MNATTEEDSIDLNGWNYRIIFHKSSLQKIGKGEFEVGAYYAIHEVYYDSDGKPTSYALRAEIVGNEIDQYTTKKGSFKSLKTILKNMKRAFKDPVLDEDIFGEKDD